jgi:conjugal transfer pilus assembly protein TraW
MRSGSLFLTALVIMATLVPGVAAADPADAALRAIRDCTADIQSAAEAGNRPAWLDANPNQAARTAGEALGRGEQRRFANDPPGQGITACRDLGQLCLATGSSDEANAALGVASARDEDSAVGEPDQITITVLVSRSLGAAQLKEIFALASGVPGVRVAFRGIREGERLADFIAGIHALLKDLDPVPDVVLDPTAFRDAGHDVAPVLIARGPDGELARVAGLADPAWLRARVLAGARGDLGALGPIEAVTEPDLIAELQRRLAALDLEKLREQAIARYWQRRTFEDLPVATVTRTQEIDPTIRAAADVRLPDGTLLVKAGETINPLDRLPFTQRLVVFDASDKRQVAIAKRLGAEAGVSRVTYIATRLDRERGWEALASVEDSLDAPVYLLTPDVRSRFALERAPATVEARGRVFVVTEHPVGEGP